MKSYRAIIRSLVFFAFGISAAIAEDKNGEAPQPSSNSNLVEFVGLVISSVDNQFAISCGTSTNWIKAECPVRWKCGDTVRVYALACTRFAHIYAQHVEILASGGGIASPVPADLSDVPHGRYDYRLIRLRGTITNAFRDEIDPGFSYLTLETRDACVVLGIRDAEVDVKWLQGFIDETVEVTGVCAPNTSGYRRFLERIIYIDPKTAMRRLSGGQAADYPRRKTFLGCVIAVYDASTFYLCDDDGQRFKVHLADGQSMPGVGQRLSVSGFLRKNVFFQYLFNSVVRAIVPNEWHQETPVDVSARSLLFDQNNDLKIQVKYEGHAIRLVGLVTDIAEANSSNAKLLLKCDDTSVTVRLGALRPPPAESVVEISGVCSIESEPDNGPIGFVRLTGFTLLPRTPTDIRVLNSPSWWTPLRLISVIAVLLVLVIAVLAWNKTLRTQVNRRSRELMSEQMSRVESELKVRERTRLAVELHDALSQNLTGVSLQLDAVKRFAADDGKRTELHLDMAMRTLKSCREELRNCLWDLRNHALEERDMNVAIRRTISPFIGDARLIIRFNVPREQLSDSTAHALMRIVRELATNAVRHGAANTIRVAGALQNGCLLFSVSDDGAGFDSESLSRANTGHFGLDGIRERIIPAGGELTIDSSPGKGCTIKIKMTA